MFDYFTLTNFIKFMKIFLDVAIVWAAFYFILKIVKNNTRTIQIFKGILLIFILKGFASLLGLRAVEYLAYIFVQYGPIAIIIIFQPEIRALLERMGKTSVFSRISTLTLNERERLVDELVKACNEMSKTKTGALISLEQGHSLNDFIKTGTPMNSVVTSELLCSIFVPGTPLHDGAVILQGVKIACAAAYFPPTTQDLPTMYGARHRAAVGISEISDCITIIVSEETGNISIAEGGKLTVVSEKSLREFLTMVVCQTQTEVVKEKIKKESDSERDLDDVKQLHQPTKSKSSKIGSIFKRKTKEEKAKTTKAKSSKEKELLKGKKKDTKTEKSNVDKMGLGQLKDETTPLDHLFESIVPDGNERSSHLSNQNPSKTSQFSRIDDTANIPAMRKPHESSRFYEKEQSSQPMHTSYEQGKKRKVVKRSNQGNEASLFDDVISPEAIVLNYRDEEDTPPMKKEGSER